MKINLSVSNEQSHAELGSASQISIIGFPL